MIMLFKFILIGLGLTIGDNFMKLWARQNYSFTDSGLYFYALAILFYVSSLTYYGLQLRTTNFGVATILPILINILLVLALTFFYYHEPLTPSQMTGAVLALAAIFFLR